MSPVIHGAGAFPMKSLSQDLIYYFDALLSDKKLKKQAWGEWLLKAILKVCRVDGAFYLEIEKMQRKRKQ